MELKHESITLSSLVRRAASPNLLNLNLFFPRRWRRPGSRLSPFPLPPRPGYLKVPIIASGIHLPYYRFTPIFHLSALLTNTKAMSFQKHIEHMHQKIQEHNEKLKPLKEMELFVLDNSLRESTVAQLRGHTIENKWKIYEEVSHVVFLMGTK